MFKKGLPDQKSFYETLENIQMHENGDNIDDLIKEELSKYVASQMYYQIMNDLEYLIETRKVDINNAESNLLIIQSTMKELVLDIMKKYCIS